MQTMLFALLLPLAAPAAVTMRPGQTITVGPGAATQVTCTALGPAPAEPGAASSAFCFCRPLPLQGSVDFHLVKVSPGPNGERNETTLRNYTRGPDCDKAIGTYPACR